MEPPLIRLLKPLAWISSLSRLVEYHGVRQPCVARLHDLIDHARCERNSLWLYAKDEVSRHGDHSLRRVLARPV